MSRKFQYKSVPSAWLEQNDLRLDCGPYMSGALEAKELLRKHSTVPLKEVAAKIFHAGRESRTWVDSPDYGVPFMGSTDVLAADLSYLPFISKKQVTSTPEFIVKKNWTLITRSGTIGRITYSRKEMDGIACSEHVMRVVPDEELILPGYLYAFLSSRFGVPQIISGTYGAIIQHIEPHHIADLPVPRLGEVEEQANELVQRAANLRVEASEQIECATNETIKELGLMELDSIDVKNFGWSIISSKNLRRRFDASFHSPTALQAEAAVNNGSHRAEKLTNVVDKLFKPPMFKRMWVEGAMYGQQFVSGNDAYLYQANEPRYVSTKTPDFDKFIVKKGWVIFQAAGQLYGLFGRPLFVYGWLDDAFCADDLFRIVPNSLDDGAYIYLFLRTPHGQALIKRQAAGNSIPRVWNPQMEEFELPWPDKPTRKQLALPVIEAHEKIAKALTLEVQGISLVERAIEEGAR